MNTSNRVAVAAVEKAATDLGLTAIDATVAERIAEYGIGALIECTLAAQDFCAIDVVLRAALHARALAHVGERAHACEDVAFTSLSDDPRRSIATTHRPQAALSLAAN
jgi:citrate lyase gamma subunit